jgi:hypothetical protein
MAQITSGAFWKALLQSILIPFSMLFIAFDAVEIASQTWAVDGDLCLEFDRWLQLKRLGIRVDCRDLKKDHSMSNLMTF